MFPYGEDGTLVKFCNNNGKSCHMTSLDGREITVLLKVAR